MSPIVKRFLGILAPRNPSPAPDRNPSKTLNLELTSGLDVRTGTLHPQALGRSALRDAVVSRQSLTLLLSMLALVGCSLQLEVLEQVDSLRRYMTIGEVLLDCSAALLFLLIATIVLWACLLLLARLAEFFRTMRKHPTSLLWRVALGVPLCYFVVDFAKTTKLRLYPHQKWDIAVWSWLGPLLIILCVTVLWRSKLHEIRTFSRTRLAPIGTLNLVLAVASVIALWIHGVHRFENFAHESQAVGAPNQPDIYLITIDTLRADGMSLYGYQRPTTPNLERFARKAFTFDFCFANSNFTTPTTTSIETGKLPWTHRIFQLGGFLRGLDRTENLGAMLRQYGYYTAFVSSNVAASPIQHRTLESYDAVEYLAPEEAAPSFARNSNLIGLNSLWTLNGPLLQAVTGIRMYLDGILARGEFPSPAERTFEAARRSITNNNKMRQPRFLWIHILPPHGPYLVPLPYRGRFLASSKLTRAYNFWGLRNDALPRGVNAEELRARYDEDVAYVDQVVGSFLDWLSETGRLASSLVVISSDHGESFERGWFMHTGPYLYNSLIRVPLLIHLPSQEHGSRITQPAQQVDLLPTILGLLGVPSPAWVEGISLVPALQGKPLTTRIIFSMNLESNSTFEPITRGTIALIDDQYKYIERLGTPESLLYRYQSDPFEKENLVSSEPAVAKRMRDLLATTLQEVNQRHYP